MSRAWPVPWPAFQHPWPSQAGDVGSLLRKAEACRAKLLLLCALTDQAEPEVSFCQGLSEMSTHRWKALWPTRRELRWVGSIVAFADRETANPHDPPYEN